MYMLYKCLQGASINTFNYLCVEIIMIHWYKKHNRILNKWILLWHLKG